jgi:hypothetical protein
MSRRIQPIRNTVLSPVRPVKPAAPSRKFVLDRRTMLRGVLGSAAVALALPPLEAMLDSHGTAFASGETLPVRFMSWFFGNGVRLEQWTPGSQGAGWELTDELAPLLDVKDYCNILSGFDNKAGYGRRGHHDGVAGAFSGHPFIELDPMGANYASKFGGPSIDQVIASAVGDQTYLPSLHLGVSKRVTKGEGPTLQYLSHKGPDEPVPSQYDPQAVFDALFNNYTPKDDPSGPLRVSLLDAVREDAKRLQLRVGTGDKQRLEAHLESIAQLQKQILAIPPACTLPGKPTETNQDIDGDEPLEAVAHAMADLVAIAWACDITRVVSWQQSGSVGGTVYWMTGATTEEHGLSHEPGGQELVHKAVVFNMECFAYLLERLQATEIGEGNLLDQSIVYLGSDCSEGLSHSTFDQPIIVAGGGGGAFKTPGIHYRSSSDENISDVLLRMIQVFQPDATVAGSNEGESSTVFHGIDV